MEINPQSFEQTLILFKPNCLDPKLKDQKAKILTLFRPNAYEHLHALSILIIIYLYFNYTNLFFLREVPQLFYKVLLIK